MAGAKTCRRKTRVRCLAPLTPTPTVGDFAPMTTPRAELIHIDVDRRLGHEWDEWDGTPLPNGGNYDSPPSLFFLWADHRR